MWILLFIALGLLWLLSVSLFNGEDCPAEKLDYDGLPFYKDYEYSKLYLIDEQSELP